MAIDVQHRIGMLTEPEKFIREHCKAGAANLVKSGSSRHGLHRTDQQPPMATEIVAHVKVIAPLTSTGPSVRARVMNDSPDQLVIRYPHVVFAGALVQIRMQSKVVFGKAQRCAAKGSEYEIEIEKYEIY